MRILRDLENALFNGRGLGAYLTIKGDLSFPRSLLSCTVKKDSADSSSGHSHGGFFKRPERGRNTMVWCWTSQLLPGIRLWVHLTTIIWGLNDLPNPFQCWPYHHCQGGCSLNPSPDLTTNLPLLGPLKLSIDGVSPALGLVNAARRQIFCVFLEIHNSSLPCSSHATALHQSCLETPGNSQE